MRYISFLLVFGVFAGNAQTLTCTFQFTDSGTLGTQSIDNAEITITTVGFIGNIVDGFAGSGGTGLYNTSASIAISGVGTFPFTAQTGITAFTEPTNGTPVYQYIYFEATGQLPLTTVIYANSSSATTNPWGMASSVGPLPLMAEIESWSQTGIIINGQRLSLYDTYTPLTFQAVLTPGVPCAGTPIGNITDIQSVINEAMGIEPADADLNADGIVNVVDVQTVIDAVMGCGLSGTTSANFRKRLR
jgi:hypothetical protein